MHQRKCSAGSSLMEYALPMAIMVLAIGLLWTIFDVNHLIGKYYMAASGRQALDKNHTYHAPDIGEGASGKVKNGSSSFDDYGSISNGVQQGIRITPTGDGLYSGSVSRGGDRPQTGGSNGDDFLYALNNPMLKSFIKKANVDNSASEYVARVLNGANTTGYLGLIKDGLAKGKEDGLGYLINYTKALVAQNAATTTYAVTHPEEVKRFGGTSGIVKVQDYIDTSVKGSHEVEDLADDVGTKNKDFKKLAAKKADYDSSTSKPGQVAAINNGYTGLQNRGSFMDQYRDTSQSNLDDITQNWLDQPKPVHPTF